MTSFSAHKAPMPSKSEKEELDAALEEARYCKRQRDKFAGLLKAAIQKVETVAASIGEEVDLEEFYGKSVGKKRAGVAAEKIIQAFGPMTFEELRHRTAAAKGGNTENESMRLKFAGTSITQKLNRGTLVLRKDGKIALP